MWVAKIVAYSGTCRHNYPVLDPGARHPANWVLGFFGIYKVYYCESLSTLKEVHIASDLKFFRFFILGHRPGVSL